MSKWRYIADLADLKMGEIYAYKEGGLEVALVRHEFGVSCFLDSCTHQPLKLSEFACLMNGKILCNAHGARFDCQSGALKGGPAEDPLKAFETKVEGGKVFYAVP
jgi:nitrite reductase/ring-hydroxylating ferredoxin subunit